MSGRARISVCSWVAGWLTGALFRAEQGTTRLPALPGLLEGQTWRGRTIPRRNQEHE
jgi:hypothetical protein